jgi:hypothetical protein
VDVDLIQEVLTQHRVHDQAAHPAPDRSGFVLDWRYFCRCGWRSEPIPAASALEAIEFFGPARDEAERHQAEQIAEALRLGAPDASGSEPELASDAPDQPVPAAVEVG